jgi:riboflavin biosynthesis pyrimidine reductase
MAKLSYSAITSLDGYVADEDGKLRLGRAGLRTLETVSSARTRLERDFDPEVVGHMKESATRDLTVGGPHLAAEALAGGLVDELHLFVVPVVVGGGTRSLPDGLRLKLELLDERRFGNGVAYLRYGTVM